MKLALIGHGAMGKLVERLAVEGGDEIVAVIADGEAALSAAALAEKLRGADAVIDFSTAAAVKRNVEAVMIAEAAAVIGTTGWQNERDAIEQMVALHNGSLVFGANFSTGVNLFYRVAEFAAELFAKFPEYEVFIEEQHHSRKKDAPSGTALKIEEIVRDEIGPDRNISVAATRAGNIPGTHRVGFDGPADQILLEHTARSREGFARGSLMAAKWIVGKKGFFEFTDVIGDILNV
ncbi:MAG: dihydrodipicolinate reductase [Chloracidobacterium sp.]|nr:dihydrodipicolinate reductase [Chloracidobacterium sp.]MCO5332729.1 hypothetical protein [Pyrinomonadaceae bacterium]